MAGESFDILYAAQNDFEDRRRRLVPFQMSSPVEAIETGSDVGSLVRRFEMHGGRCRRGCGRQLIAVGRIVWHRTQS